MSISGRIDHTLLKPFISLDDIERLCREADQYGFASVCVPPYFVDHAVSLLRNSPSKVCSVVGFPYGYDPVNSKAECIKKLCDNGADEIDVVLCLAAIKNAAWSYLEDEMNVLATCAHMKDRVIKAIVETGFLNEEQLARVCELSVKVGFDFVKTSTGINAEGATEEVVKKMRVLLPEHVKIKASGGIRSYDQAIGLINAGADRIGASASIQIIEEEKK